MMKDVVIIPTYNEKENIGNLVRSICLLYPNVHILVVDDNSPDGTALEVEAAKKELPNLELLLRPKKEGLGRAYIAAFKRVLGDESIRSLCTMDADFSHSAKYLATMFSEIDKFDVVVGSRYIQDGGVEGYKILRKMISIAASLYCRIIFHLPIKDYTSGFLCIKTDFLRKVDFKGIESSGFAFLIELKYLLWKMGAQFKEFPILLKNRKEGKSKIGKNIMLEGFSLPWKLFFKDYGRKIINLSRILKDVVKKRGIFFILYYVPMAISRIYLEKKKGFFIFQNKKYEYFYHLYNCTCLNERAVEIPIVWEIARNYSGKRILELGNVLSHYYDFPHDIIDKYEKAEGVINQDIINFEPKEKYDLIVSISTLEHVDKVLSALENLKRNLKPGGKIIVTMSLGWNKDFDKLLWDGKLAFEKQYFMKKISDKNEWEEVSFAELGNANYDHKTFSARGLFIGTYVKS